MSDDIKAIFNRVKLTDELAGETKKRPEVDIKSNYTFKEDDTIDSHLTSESDDLSSSAFDVLDDLETEAPKKEVEVEEVDPEASARSAINLLDILQQSVIMPIAAVKLQKRYGGKERLKEMRQALAKSLLEEKLSDDEKKLISSLKSYDSTLKQVTDAIPFKDADKKLLEPSTIEYCKKHGIKINEGLAFGGGVINVLAPRVIKLIMI